MSFVGRFSKRASELTLKIAKALVCTIGPKYRILQGQYVPNYDAELDNGYIRIVNVIRGGLEWGIRLKPFPFSPLEFQATAYTAETGLRLKLTLPYIVSIGVLIAPKQFKKVRRLLKTGYVFSASLTAISLLKHDHNNHNPVVPVFEWDAYRLGSARTSVYKVTVIRDVDGTVVIDTLQSITTLKEHKLIGLLNKRSYLVADFHYPIANDKDYTMHSVRRSKVRSDEILSLGNKMVESIKEPLKGDDIMGLYDVASVIQHKYNDYIAIKIGNILVCRK